MGTKSGSTYAYLFMGIFEQDALKRWSSTQPHELRRYIDDILQGVWTKFADGTLYWPEWGPWKWAISRNTPLHIQLGRPYRLLGIFADYATYEGGII